MALPKMTQNFLVQGSVYGTVGFYFSIKDFPEAVSPTSSSDAEHQAQIEKLGKP